MKVNLINVDGFHYPNLALMKLSAFHRGQGDEVELDSIGNFDITYKSKTFTYTKEQDQLCNSIKTIKGGTGYKIYDTLPEEVEHILPDYSLYNCESAYGFLTRGCIRKCEWCIVPKKEGALKPHADITEFIGNMKSAILMDNNVLASDWGLKQIEKIIDLKIKVDFNQGLDARIIANNPDIAKLLSRVKWFKPLRMACDKKEQMESVGKATELLRKYGTKPSRYFCYVLVNEVDDALERINYLRSINVDPFAQPYRDFENNTVDKESIKLARWCNLRQLKGVKYKDYNDALTH